MSVCVSAIVPVHNRAEHLAAAVESLIAPRYPGLEIVIVDDGSVDRTLEVARELSDRFPEVRTIRHADGGNHGPGASRNLGVRAAGGRYVCFLDSDDVVLPHRFERAVRLMEGDDTIDAVCEPFLVDAGRGPKRAVGEGESRRFAIGSRKRWHTDSVLIRRRRFLDLGGFSERLRTCEDLVLWGKLNLSARIENGGTEPVAVYRLHPGNTDVILENSLKAHLEVLEWARARALDKETRASLSDVVWGKTLYVSDRLRRNGHPKLAFRMLLAAVRINPAFAIRRSLWKNLLRSAIEGGTGTWEPR